VGKDGVDQWLWGGEARSGFCSTDHAVRDLERRDGFPLQSMRVHSTHCAIYPTDMVRSLSLH
jgi:hypothetical protein